MFSQPYGEGHPRTRLLHLDEVVREDDECPVAIPTGVNQLTRSSFSGDAYAQVVDRHIAQLALLPAALLTCLRLQLVADSSVSTGTFDDTAHSLINSLPQILHVLHQVNRPVRQALRCLPMR